MLRISKEHGLPTFTNINGILLQGRILFILDISTCDNSVRLRASLVIFRLENSEADFEDGSGTPVV